MAEIVFEVVALGLQGVDVFVLNLPPTAASGHDLGHVLLADEVAGDEGGVEAPLAAVVGDGQLAPVDLRACLIAPQPYPVEESIAVGPVIVKLVVASTFMDQADAFASRELGERALGLSITSPTGSQFRTCPDHRAGLLLFASS